MMVSDLFRTFSSHLFCHKNEGNCWIVIKRPADGIFKNSLFIYCNLDSTVGIFTAINISLIRDLAAYKIQTISQRIFYLYDGSNKSHLRSQRPVLFTVWFEIQIDTAATPVR